MLEAREVPAVYIWNPELDPNSGEEEIQPFVHVASNWVNPSGVRYTEAPDADDDLVFTTLPYNDTPPNFPTSVARITSASSSSFQSITIHAGYIGPVSIERSLTVGSFTQHGATVDQVGAGLNLYVTASFVFTGGVLNNTTNLGTIHLQGATGTIDPVDGGIDAEIGSTLVLESRNGIATTLTQLPGTLWTANNAGMDVYANCVYQMPAQPGAGPVKVQQRFGKSTKDGVLRIFLLGSENIDQATTDDRAILVLGGSLNITHNTTISGVLDPQILDTSSPSIRMEGGTIRIKNGIELSAGIEVLGGLFRTIPGAPGTTVATISRSFAISGGAIILGFELGQPHVFSDLFVKRQFLMAGGTFFAGVDGTTGSTKSDRIFSGGEMILKAGSKVSPQVFTPPQGGVSGRVWQVFQSTEVINTNELATDAGWTPTIDQPKKKIFISKNA